MTSKPLPESSILRPRPESLENSDEWPEFELKDVRVYYASDPSTPANLLEASVHNPLSLTGYLEPIAKNQTKLLLKSTAKRAPMIEIAEVRMYAYGQAEEGRILFWAAGKAGWFTLSPLRAYKAMWEEISEAVTLFYWIADAYRARRPASGRKNAANLPDYTAEELFEAYSEGMKGVGEKKARESMYRHKEFLFASMIAGKEGINWKRNPLYMHLKGLFPEVHEVVKARLTGVGLSKRQSQIVRQGSMSSSGSNGVKRKRGQVEPESSEVGSGKGVGRSRKPDRMSQVADAKPARPSPARRRGARTPESEPGTPEDDGEQSARPAMKGRSILRPKPTMATKGAAKGGKAPLINDDDENDELAISPVPTKQQLTQQSQPQPKAQDEDEGIDIPSSPSDAAGGASDPASLNHIPDPLQHDTWNCALAGCTHKVYCASLPDSQRLIREHYALHAYDDDDRVQLVKQLQQPFLPSAHLMERVKMQARAEGFPGSRNGVGEVAVEGGYSRFPVGGRVVRKY
ncbi:hypothetical protein B0A48_00205 [Cryoendolithus antarcticus]|uniref:DNA (cytosine-5)-methyltransferase 1 replication foci domain-containing protein n=1 Tax=Cryoendolithus antarcticus TaxID=1507870 RepID=A0A1V8TU39_9PEZI|nr:hypothetical protein B0A48_00205 [Cryoendolithus antarcticus]